MAAELAIRNFIRATFRSVWSLELLILLRGQPARSWSPEALVAALRSSELIVAQGLASLTAAGLVIVDEAGARYSPATPALDDLVAGTVSLYARSPDAVRRLIIAAATGSVSAFADAFRWKKDPE